MEKLKQVAPSLKDRRKKFSFKKLKSDLVENLQEL